MSKDIPAEGVEVSMAESVAILMLGSMSDEEILKVNGVTLEDLLKARRLLRKVKFSRVSLVLLPAAF